jgi:hypothetical protein
MLCVCLSVYLSVARALTVQWLPERAASLATFVGHEAPVYTAMWSPHAPDVFASVSADCSLRVRYALGQGRAAPVCDNDTGPPRGRYGTSRRRARCRSSRPMPARCSRSTGTSTARTRSPLAQSTLASACVVVALPPRAPPYTNSTQAVRLCLCMVMALCLPPVCGAVCDARSYMVL